MIFLITSFQHKRRLVPKIINIELPENNFFKPKKRSTFKYTNTEYSHQDLHLFLMEAGFVFRR